MSKLLQLFRRKTSDQADTTSQLRMGSDTGTIQGMRVVKKIPFFGNKSFKDQYKILLWILIPLSVATVATVVYGGIERGYTAQRIERVTRLQMLSQRTARLAVQMSNGDIEAAKEMNNAIKQVNTDLDALKNGAPGLAASSGAPVPLLNAYETQWRVQENHAKDLLNSSDALLSLRGQSAFIKDAANAGLQLVQSVRVATMDGAVTAGSSQSQLLLNTLNQALGEMAQLMQTIETAVVIPDGAAVMYRDTASLVKNAVNHLLNGSTDLGIPAVTDQLSKERMGYVRQIVTTFTEEVLGFQGLMNTASSAKQAAFLLNEQADSNLSTLQSLTQKYAAEERWGAFLNFLAAMLGLTALMVGFFWVWLKLQETRVTTAQLNESIAALMDDMMEISDGNLTVRARMSENMTGSIADSLNLTVQRLNRTLAGVKDSSQTVHSGAEQMTTDAAVILEEVRQQTDKIRLASSGVNSISDSVQAVAFASQESASVADKQRHTTQQGRQAVQDAITAMNGIRDRIQDTAKRIKRLGESAQEIDEIIELISDTTEQTNVLAMNASIQAAAAGEAGRGFRAVATEVQRLAERSDQSLRRIVALIRSMQADTQNAVAAMEQSTQEVVVGTETTNKAGQALDEIEKVSGELNQLIDSINDATQEQTKEANQITTRMGEILQISNSTARGVEKTTAGIQKIAGMAEELDRSMDNFKLQ